MPTILRHVPFGSPAGADESDQPSALVAAVIASIEGAAGHLREELTRGEFRELVRARGRSCDEAWEEIRRAALARDAAPVGDAHPTAGSPAGSIAWPGSIRRGRRPITGSAPAAGDGARLLALAAENARLRQIVADQRLDIEGLRSGTRPG